MNFLVIGHLCYDEIYADGNEPVTGFGGIYYAVTALAAVANDKHKIIPVFGVGKDREKELYSNLSTYPNIVTDGIYSLDTPTNTVKLFYGDTQERVECSEHIAPPIPVAAVKPFIQDADGVLVNMVSGFDITFDMMYMISEEKKSRTVPVYFDIHSMTLGIDEKNKRFRRPVIDWRRWAFHASVVQMNELEAGTLTVERLSDIQLAKLMMSLGPSAMVITRGKKGAHVYYANKKKVVENEIPGIGAKRGKNNDQPSTTIDPTGCGDVFGAAYLYNYVITGDIVGSAQFANRIAARKAEITGSESMQRLSDELVNGTE